jgi:hypothetical protein
MPITIENPDNQQQAAFVFTGKVTKVKAATLPEVPTDNTVIMQIEHIIKAPPMFTSITGQQITVRFHELPSVEEGAVLTVFANGWIFAQSIAVDAVNYSRETDRTAVASSVQESVMASADNDLKERIESADMAVVGKVVKVERVELNERAVALNPSAVGETETTHISEHDPDWHEATLQLDEVVKGPSDAKEVKVVFPQSDDVRWYAIRKYQEGQQGIWLLQQGKTQSPRGIPPKVFAAIPERADVYTAIHTDDYLPLHELGRVKSLLNK